MATDSKSGCGSLVIEPWPAISPPPLCPLPSPCPESPGCGLPPENWKPAPFPPELELTPVPRPHKTLR